MLPLAAAAPDLPWSQVRLGAGLMLILYIVLAAVYGHRELAFLGGLASNQRRNFLLLDLLIQAAVLVVLLPCILASGPSLSLFTLILTGFGLLWILVIWNGVARSLFAYKMMSEHRSRMAQAIRADAGAAGPASNTSESEAASSPEAKND